MPYALELALDDAAGAVVRRLWRDLAAAGFPFMAESGAVPHVSLAIWNHVDREAMEDAVRRFAAETPTIEVVLPAVGAFVSTGVAFLTLEPSMPLREAQARCHRLLAPAGREAWPHYAPDAWIPHCTLAMDLGDAAGHVAGRLLQAPLPLAGQLVRAELVEFRPVRTLMTAPLQRP